MRIVHICQRDDPSTGGSLRVAEALVREQRRAGHESWLLFLYGPPAHVSRTFQPRVICLGLNSSRQALPGIRRLRRRLLEIEPDIIHAHDGILWPRLSLLHLRIPVVMHSHLPAGITGFKSKIGWSLVKHTTDYLIGISTHTLDTWTRAGYPAAKTLLIPNGVDFDRFRMVDGQDRTAFRRKLGLPEDAEILLWVGRVQRSMKGSDRVEKIAAMLSGNKMMVVVGSGPEYEAMQKRCRALIEAGSLVMVGATPTPEDYYKAADAFLFTSYHEPFGLVILEAVASGLPILSFPVNAGGGAIDLLSEFEATEVGDDIEPVVFPGILHQVLGLKGKAESLREEAEQKYNWRLISGRVTKVYETVLHARADESGMPRVLVCQHGARHRYAVPRILEQAGLLCALYTDSSSESFLGKCIKIFGHRVPSRWQRFARWEIHGIPREKVFSSDYSHWPEMWQRLVKSPKSGIYLYQQRHRRLSLKMMGWGLKGANLVYSMYHENLDFIRWAKYRGARSIVDVFVSPATNRIMEEESRLFPDWSEPVDRKAASLERMLWEQTAAVADLLICPSEWVADGVRATTPSAASKIRVVPYGCSIDYQGRVNQPVPGRILFAGRDALRKGLHYLAQAAIRLKVEFPWIDVRIAGEMPEQVTAHPICRELHFLGPLNTAEMEQEYLSADVLVLAALSEGFAGVVAEAISAGCPVIVTREAGSPVIHEREGLIVPSRNVDALVDALRRMLTDRGFRGNCSAACIEQVPFYGEQQWCARLVAAMKECING